MKSLINKILYYASTAPSFYNIQPWSITLIDNDLFIKLKNIKKYLTLDLSLKNFYASLGCFAEAFYLSSKFFGIKSTITYLKSSEYLLKISLYPAKARDPNILTYIQKRHTNRSRYLTDEFTEQDLSLLKAGFKDMIYLPFSSNEAQITNQLFLESFFININNPVYLNSLSEYITFSESPRPNYGIRITPNSYFNIIDKLFKIHYTDVELIGSDRFKKYLISIAEDQLYNHGGWLIISSKKDSIKNSIIAGRIYYRLAISLVDECISVQPFGDVFSNPVRYEKLKELSSGRFPQIVLRSGYKSSIVSNNIESFLRSNITL